MKKFWEFFMGNEDSPTDSRSNSYPSNGIRRSPYFETHEIIREEVFLGGGSFGDVYKGKFKDGNAEVALKLLKKLNGQIIREFSDEHKKEIGILLKAKHKNIVEYLGVVNLSIDCYNIGTAVLCNFLIFEYIANGNARDYVKDPDTTQEILLDISFGIACGMAYLHENDIIHRDLAARNILIDSEHKAKISDFGLSSIINENHDHYTIKETTILPSRWIPRECLQTRGKLNKSSDVWAYGVTLWEIWNKGGVPYRDPDTHDNRTDEEVRNALRAGKNPMSFEIPKGILGGIKGIMYEVFVEEDLRPTFSYIKSFLDDMINLNKDLAPKNYLDRNFTSSKIESQNSDSEAFYSAESEKNWAEISCIPEKDQPIAIKSTDVSKPTTAEVYKMNSNPKGKVLIINNDFRCHQGMRRHGSEKDVKRLKEFFKKQGFEVEVNTNKSKKELCEPDYGIISEFIYGINNADERLDSCFIILMSHGDEGDQIQMVDNTSINLFKDVIQRFSNDNKGLFGIPKIFITQACRGSNMDGISLPADGVSWDAGESHHLVPTSKLYPPRLSDTLLIFPSLEGNAAYRNPAIGSHLINNLLDAIQENPDSSINDQLIATNAKMKVISGHKISQNCMEWRHLGFRKFYFNPPPDSNFFKREIANIGFQSPQITD